MSNCSSGRGAGGVPCSAPSPAPRWHARLHPLLTHTIRYNSPMRKTNAIVAAIITAFFLAHATLGATALHVDIPSSLSWTVWIGAALVCAHIVFCIATSTSMLTDAKRPPSQKKKRHLALKWITGALLLAVAIPHAAEFYGGDRTPLLAILLIIAVAAHACVGAKSLLKDLSLPRTWRPAFRAIVCIIAALAGIATLIAVLT